MTIIIPLWIYLLAVSGIGQVNATFSVHSPDPTAPIETEHFLISSFGGSRFQLGDPREIKFDQNTSRADLWWTPPLMDYFCKPRGYDCYVKLHLKTLIELSDATSEQDKEQ
mgnify:CR=1 FL=1